MFSLVKTFVFRFVSAFLLLLYSMFNKGLKYKNGGIILIFFRLKGSVHIDLREGVIINSKIKIEGKNNILIFEENVQIRNCIFLIKGDNCILHIRGNRQIVDTRFELLDSNCQVIVGNDTGFNKNRILVAGNKNKIVIGSGCIFAENAEVWASDTHSIIDMNTNERINIDKEVLIGNRVWIGNRALIHKGVSIGNDSIVAAGSIVTKSVANNTLVAGIPAAPIKNNLKWNIQRL